MLLHFLEGVQANAIPKTPVATCKKTFDTARDAATRWQLKLFEEVGFIQADRSTDNVSDTQRPRHSGA